MGRIVIKEDARALEIERKSKKSKKNKTNDLIDIDDGEGYLEADGVLPKEKGQKQREKKITSELNEDGDEAVHKKGNMGGDGELRKKDKKKKRKRDSTEDNHPPTEKAQIDEKERGPVDPDCDPESSKEKKRKHEVLEKKLGNDDVLSSVSKGEEVVYDEVDGMSSSGGDIAEMINGIVDANKKNTQRGEKKSDAWQMKKISDGKAIEISREYSEGETFEKVEKKKKMTKKKKKKKKKKADSHDSDSEVRGVMTGESGKGGSTSQGQESVDGENTTQSTLKKPDSEDIEVSKGQKKKKTKSVDNNSEEPKARGKSKRVSFSGHVEVFPSSDTHNEKQKIQEDNLVRGKRFTLEEDEIVKEAVFNYIKAHDLGEEGLTKVLNCQSYPGLKNCWKEIGTCIPYRPHTAIYYRAHILFERAEKREWTAEETEFLQKSYEKHGNNWKMVAEELGKHRIHVKDKWRRIKLSNKKGGQWTQDEYQGLYDLVNLDLQMKVVSQEKKSKHGMLRDNIPWGAISDKLSTRSDSTCCKKWYEQLTSSLVAENKWSNADDYRLISALYDMDAACVEDVDWDTLLEHRSGDVCRKRWDQMVLHIGHHGSKPFSEQVETLAKRYCPDLAETREAWDSKPVVQ